MQEGSVVGWIHVFGCNIHRVFAFVVKDPLPEFGTLVTLVQNLEVIVYSTSLVSN